MKKLISKINNLQTLPKIVVLTGAGISAESGIKTFRDTNGLWEDHDINEVASPVGFQKDPELVYRFYNIRRRQASSCKPNAAHLALVELESLLGDNSFLVTQNVDSLHDLAGSKRLCHMHGELIKARCVKCEKIYYWPNNLDVHNCCVACEGTLRPHIVWFGEIPFHMKETTSLVAQCDIFVAIGTSGQVYPAAGLVRLAEESGAYTLEINQQDTGSGFDDVLEGLATKCVPEFVAAVKSAISKKGE